MLRAIIFRASDRAGALHRRFKSQRELVIITAQISRNVSIMTRDSTRAYATIFTFAPTSNRRPIISSGAQARPLIIPYKVIFVISPAGPGAAEQTAS